VNALVQELLAGLLVLAAVGYLLWRRLRKRDASALCEGCPSASCASRGEPEQVQRELVTIDEPGIQH
jgi:hypothetical protein